MYGTWGGGEGCKGRRQIEGLDCKGMECGPHPANTFLFYFSGEELSGVKGVRVQLFALSLHSSSPAK